MLPAIRCCAFSPGTSMQASIARCSTSLSIGWGPGMFRVLIFPGRTATSSNRGRRPFARRRRQDLQQAPGLRRAVHRSARNPRSQGVPPKHQEVAPSPRGQRRSALPPPPPMSRRPTQKGLPQALRIWLRSLPLSAVLKAAASRRLQPILASIAVQSGPA